jgi:hypothetical protein
MSELWSYQQDVWTDGRDVVGYDVHATDGSIGKIGDSTLESGRQHVVVDTGPWIFGKKRLIPARAITRIEHEDEVVHLNLTKDQIKDAPDFDDVRRDDEEHRSTHGEYYRPHL